MRVARTSYRQWLVDRTNRIIRPDVPWTWFQILAAFILICTVGLEVTVLIMVW